MSANNTIRIRTTVGGSDKYLKTELNQDFDFIEILSLKLSQEETYKKFCSDYGVIVGRVIINNGFGVPNAKVSVFIPLSDEDKLNPEIKGLYPFEVITDKDSDGVRYNLFPKDAGNEDNECFTPIGTFNNKRELLDNELVGEVYCKYYKFTTTTNHAGDFMLFGVPLGSYIVHVDADISDIGIASQRPYDLIDQGTPIKMFSSTTKFKSDKNLDKLVQVKTLNSGVNVQPFWGDTENCEIGITRLDFDLNYNVRPAAIFVGSIFGDSEKNSVNKHCRPRKNLGEICENITSEGTIDMIRKTIDGQIEEFSVDGGRVIDENGVWAYQIPMNLDYMVTDENGDLILSEDPNRGIPTRASVRFRIGMDVTGGEGKLRTRAKYLVPHNPQNHSEVNYTFDETTPDTHFRDLYWNKIYSVKSFISRYQKAFNALPTTLAAVNDPNTIAIKDVDGCVGTHTPFPYNRIRTILNPLYVILCVIIGIIVSVIALINGILIRLINIIIGTINSIISAICSVINTLVSWVCDLRHPFDSSAAASCKASRGCSFAPINYIPCITLECPTDDPLVFAPGCGGDTSGWTAANSTRPIDHWAGLTNGHSCEQTLGGSQHDGHDNGLNGSGLLDCYAVQLAEALDVFTFEFYNDWVNGSLYSFLLKYKKKKKGREVFCEYDCADFGGGVDGNENGVSDNDCRNAILIDSCVGGTGNVSNGPTVSIRDGVVTKYDDELYYAPITHSGEYRLYATDIINLGSIFDCDWQGIPKIQPALIPTSYKKPPLITELNDSGVGIECGMTSIGSGISNDGLFFSITCLNTNVDERHCLNVRKICELGVDIDEAQYDSLGNIIPTSYGSLDCTIGSNEIFDDFTRDAFYGLNINGPSLTTMVWPSTIPSNSTSFNITNVQTSQVNGTAYNNFRAFTNTGGYDQPRGNSYFFYFGLLPGYTAIEKMNSKYFSNCNRTLSTDFLIQLLGTDTSSLLLDDGTITFTFIGGIGPFTYSWTNLAGTYSTGPTTTTTNGPFTITGLETGTYTITVTDALGNTLTQTINITGPLELYCSSSLNQNATNPSSSDGSAIITSLGGGIPPYSISVNGNSPYPVSVNDIIYGLPIGNNTLIITDSTSSTTGCTSNIFISSAPTLSAVYTGVTNEGCRGNFGGAFTIAKSGGLGPYTLSTTGPSGYASTTFTNTGLRDGVYTSILSDSSSQVVTITTTLTSSPLPVINGIGTWDNYTQCDPSNVVINFNIVSGVAPFTINYVVDTLNQAPVYTSTAGVKTLTIAGHPTYTGVRITVTDANGCVSLPLTYSPADLAADVYPTINVSGLTALNLRQCSPTTTYINFNATGLMPMVAKYKIDGGATVVQSITGAGMNTIVTTSTIMTDVEIQIVSNANTCSTGPAYTPSITIPVADIALPSVGLAVTIQELANIFSVLSLTIDAGRTPISYNWYKNGVLQSTFATYTWAGSGDNIQLVVTDSVGCTASSNILIST